MKTTVQQKVSEVLDEQVLHLDAASLSRLNQARQQALEIHHRRSGARRRGLAAGLALASAALLMVSGYVGVMQLDHQDLPEADNLQAEQEEVWQILSLDVDLELVEELEFYRWLDEQQTAEDA